MYVYFFFTYLTKMINFYMLVISLFWARFTCFILLIEAPVINAVRFATAPEVQSIGGISLTSGVHPIRVLRYQYTGRDPLILSWKRPGASAFEIVPSQVLSHAVSIEIPPAPALKPGLVGRFFNTVSAEPPNQPFGSKVFSQLNYTSANQRDVFEVGRSVNFSGLFTGYLSLPVGYASGNYQVIVGHDDGAYMYLGGALRFNDDGPITYVEHGTTINLLAGQHYPMLVHYQQFADVAQLGLFWIKPDGTRELIPANALSY